MKTVEQVKPMSSDIEEGTYITELKDVTVWGGSELKDYYAEVYVKWNFHVEYRSWGVKSISVYSTQVQATVYDYDTGDTVHIIDTFEMDGWTVEDEGVKLDHSVMPQSCSLDLKNKDITIEW